jgi:hypothetical protein
MLAIHAAWVLAFAFILSFVYETWRVTFMRHVSEHDTVPAYLKNLAVYVVAALAIWALFAGIAGAAWIGLAVAVIGIGVSTFYYNPVIMRDRQPGIVDWVEDIVFTGLLFVAAALLIYDLGGYSLARAD